MARTGDIPALTGVRGLAAVGVMAFHYWFYDWAPMNTVGGAACARGYIFVDLFFLLSGFVMAAAYGRTFAGGFGAADYARFIAVRLARIYPVYAVVLAVTVAIAVVHPLHSADTGAAPLLANLTLTQAWFEIPSTIGTAWSLSTEWAVYLVFPLFVAALLASRPRTASATCAAACASLVARGIHTVGGGGRRRPTASTRRPTGCRRWSDASRASRSASACSG
jgi:peptidoglycan/LPS O-acetylase OafA/YrhL